MMEYGLIGEHLGHSYSPEIHRKIGDYPYELCELRPEQVVPFLERHAFKAINVTIPYKQTVMPCLYHIDESALKIGAVNTVVNRGGKLYGYNTDFAGICATLAHKGLELRGKKVLILGTGGTSKTALAVAESLGAASVTRVSRTGKEGAITYEEALESCRDAEILFNTTPVGMFPKVGVSPLSLDAFPRLEGIMDAIYNPLATELVMDGQARGIPSVSGLYMLSAQAVHAAALFFDRPTDQAAIEEVYRKVLWEKENITLLGLPGLPVQAVAEAVARLSGKQYVDVAALCAGKSADERQAVMEELSVKSGAVLAVEALPTDEKTWRALRRNGKICLMTADHEESIAACEQRADITSAPGATPEETAKAIIERIKE